MGFWADFILNFIVTVKIGGLILLALSIFVGACFLAILAPIWVGIPLVLLLTAVFLALIYTLMDRFL